MVSKASDDFPDPLTPVKTTRLLAGNVRSTFLRLCVRAPRTMSDCTADCFSEAITINDTAAAGVRQPEPVAPGGLVCYHRPESASFLSFTFQPRGDDRFVFVEPAIPSSSS